MNTREKILGKTEEFILENGIEKLTIQKLLRNSILVNQLFISTLKVKMNF